MRAILKSFYLVALYFTAGSINIPAENVVFTQMYLFSCRPSWFAGGTIIISRCRCHFSLSLSAVAFASVNVGSIDAVLNRFEIKSSNQFVVARHLYVIVVEVRRDQSSTGIPRVG